MGDVWSLVSLGAGSLVAVIAIFWKMHLDGIKDTKTRLTSFENKEKQATEKMFSLSNRVTELEATREGYTAGVDKVIAEVIKDIRASRK